jgi:N-acyl-D-amino-acid deacylase
MRIVTSLPAPQVGIARRGSIEVSNYADLVIFDPDTVAGRATGEAPHVLSVGIENVWVNGRLVYDAGNITGHRPGKPARQLNL